MGHKFGVDRLQIQFTCLEDAVAEDNVVRVIDSFVDMLDLASFGFQHTETKAIGASAYSPAVLLKLYFYGYYNRIRSSRKLELECTRNIELKWLINGLLPSYHTISTFRTFKDDKLKINHSKSLKQIFRAFNRFLNGEGLFGAKTVATDGTKIRAQNARKKNFTEDKIKKKLQLADKDIEKYLAELAQNDTTENGAEQNNKALLAYLEDAKARKEKYEALQAELKKRQESDPTITQISKTDPEARSIVLNNSGHSEIAFNAVSVVDEKNCLIVDFSIENTKDSSLLASSLIAAKAEFDTDFAPDLYPFDFATVDNNFDIRTKLNPETSLIGLADKGFRNGKELQECKDFKIVTYVPPIELAFSGKDSAFTKDKFIYDTKEDTYTCPNQKTLKTNGTLYDKKDRHGIVNNQYKLYKAELNDCRNCPFSDKCVAKSQLDMRHGRVIERSIFEQAIKENDQRYETPEGRAIYKRRQAIVEHPFGTIKRSWGYYYTLLKGIEKVTAEFSFVATSYNLRRSVSLLGVKALIMKLKAAKSSSVPSFKPIFALILSRFIAFSNFRPSVVL